MTEDYVLPSQMYRRLRELSEWPYSRSPQIGPRTAATIQEIKAEGTRCFGGRAPRPVNDEQGVQP